MKNVQKITIAALLASSAIWGVSQVYAQLSEGPPEVQAKLDFDIQVATAQGSKAWKDAFNSGDAAAATAMYEDDAVMVVTPFGTYTGKQEILAFWTDLMKNGFDDVIYSNTKTTVLDNQSARVSADWTMNNAHGVITNELWVLQPDGRALLREDHFEVAQ